MLMNVIINCDGILLINDLLQKYIIKKFDDIKNNKIKEKEKEKEKEKDMNLSNKNIKNINLIKSSTYM